MVGRARSGEEAITAIESLGPDLVLMDHVMPGMRGIEATRAIKTRPGAPRIIVLTSHDRADLRAAAEAAGADGFLSKLDFASAVTAMQPPPPPDSSKR